MRFGFFLTLLVSAFLACTAATPLGTDGSPSDSKKIQVKKELSRLRGIRMENTEDRMFVPPVAAYANLLHSTSTTSTQSSQILHAVENSRPLPKGVKAVIAVIGVGIVTGAIVGSVMIAKMLEKAFDTSGSAA